MMGRNKDSAAKWLVGMATAKMEMIYQNGVWKETIVGAINAKIANDDINRCFIDSLIVFSICYTTITF